MTILIPFPSTTYSNFNDFAAKAIDNDHRVLTSTGSHCRVSVVMVRDVVDVQRASRTQLEVPGPWTGFQLEITLKQAKNELASEGKEEMDVVMGIVQCLITKFRGNELSGFFFYYVTFRVLGFPSLFSAVIAM